jgi:hypothetical protein
MEKYHPLMIDLFNCEGIQDDAAEALLDAGALVSDTLPEHWNSVVPSAREKEALPCRIDRVITNGTERFIVVNDSDPEFTECVFTVKEIDDGVFVFFEFNHGDINDYMKRRFLSLPDECEISYMPRSEEFMLRKVCLRGPDFRPDWAQDQLKPIEKLHDQEPIQLHEGHPILTSDLRYGPKDNHVV